MAAVFLSVPLVFSSPRLPKMFLTRLLPPPSFVPFECFGCGSPTHPCRRRGRALVAMARATVVLDGWSTCDGWVGMASTETVSLFILLFPIPHPVSKGTRGFPPSCWHPFHLPRCNPSAATHPSPTPPTGSLATTQGPIHRSQGGAMQASSARREVLKTRRASSLRFIMKTIHVRSVKHRGEPPKTWKGNASSTPSQGFT